jgi:hypothetical protein
VAYRGLNVEMGNLFSFQEINFIHFIDINVGTKGRFKRYLLLEKVNIFVNTPETKQNFMNFAGCMEFLMKKRSGNLTT